MSDLRELYQDLILDHTKCPRNFGELEGANCTAEGFNPLCGDQVTIHLVLEDGVVKDVNFEGKGCAISTASASMMTEIIKGKTVDEVTALFQRFHSVVTSPAGSDIDLLELGKLAALAGVREFPLRVKCAILAWHTLRSALEDEDGVVTTE
jgi:nitrogen fixation NifU-like protein